MFNEIVFKKSKIILQFFFYFENQIEKELIKILSLFSTKHNM